MQEIKLQLTLPEINLILEGLGNLPYARVFELVSKVQAQAGDQIRADKEDTGKSNAGSPG